MSATPTPAAAAAAGSRSAEELTLTFTLDGRAVEVADDGATLLEVVRDRLGNRSPKDGCSPQGQCGCCTVLVDGAPRVACVTPVRRVAGRSVVTAAGLPDDERTAWADAFCATGRQPVRLLHTRDPRAPRRAEAQGRHRRRRRPARPPVPLHGVAHHPRGLCRLRARASTRDLEAASRGPASRAACRSGSAPTWRSAAAGSPTTPPRPTRSWRYPTAGAVGRWARPSPRRLVAGKVQGRRTTVAVRHPLEVPPGEWDVTLRTTWVEPAYLEPDASWCAPGGEPATPLANGGAFGGKAASVAPARGAATGRRARPRRARAALAGGRRGPRAQAPPGRGGSPARRHRDRARRPHARDRRCDEPRWRPASSSRRSTWPGRRRRPRRAAGWAEAVVLLAGARGEAAPVRSPAGAVAEAAVTT